MPAKLTTSEFIAKAHAVHCNRYDYSKVMYKSYNTKVVITCVEHGDFLKTPEHHLQGQGCIVCTGHKDTTETFIAKAKLVHNGLYNYDKLIYSGSNQPVLITCSVHGEFKQPATSHIQGHGCPTCKADGVSKRQLSNTIDFVNKAKQIHSDLYTYDKVVYVKSIKAVIITCPQHGDFFQTPRVHLNGSGCTKCMSSKVSKVCVDWLESIMLLESIYIQHAGNIGEFNIPKTRITVDGYCHETKTVYEYYGDYWHGNPYRYNPTDINPTTYTTMNELYQRTINREHKIKKLGYNLITKWETAPDIV